MSNWLRRFTQETLRPLIRLNQELVLDTLARLDVPRLTLDVDRTIVRTGATVAWAFMRTLRFVLITRAGRLTRIGGRNVLRLAQNPATEALYARIQHALAA